MVGIAGTGRELHVDRYCTHAQLQYRIIDKGKDANNFVANDRSSDLGFNGAGVVYARPSHYCEMGPRTKIVYYTEIVRWGLDIGRASQAYTRQTEYRQGGLLVCATHYVLV